MRSAIVARNVPVYKCLFACAYILYIHTIYYCEAFCLFIQVNAEKKRERENERERKDWRTCVCGFQLSCIFKYTIPTVRHMTGVHFPGMNGALYNTRVSTRKQRDAKTTTICVTTNWPK